MKLIVVSVCVATLTGCTRTHTISHFAENVDVHLGQTVQRPPKGPSTITLKEIDLGESRAYLQITGPEGTDEGWVRQGSFVDFSKQTGAQGLEVVAVHSNRVAIVSRSAGYSNGRRIFP
jgi:hypothetical protein